MSKQLWLAGVVVVAVLSALVFQGAVTAYKEEVKESKEKEDVNTTIVKDLHTAAEVAEFGRKNKAPEAMVTAGSLLLKVAALTGGKLPELDVQVEDEKGNKIAAPAEKAKSFKEQAEDLFDQASGLNAPGVDALIKAAKTRKYEGFGSRDVEGGPKQITRKIQIGGLNKFNFKFKPNREASVVLQSNHDVRFVVFQPGAGNLMSLVCTNGQYFWTPKGKQDVEIEVRVQNMGKQAEYTLTVK